WSGTCATRRPPTALATRSPRGRCSRPAPSRRCRTARPSCWSAAARARSGSRSRDRPRTDPAGRTPARHVELRARALSYALVAGSNTRVFFDGASSVVIPPGGSVRSDPVTMSVIAREDLAVSLYIPDAAAHPAAHTSAQIQSFMTANGAGDTAAAEAKTAFT